MKLTNQNREDIRSSMGESEYRNLIIKTFPELNSDKFNVDIPALAKMVAIHIFIHETLFGDEISFEVSQSEILTRNILKNLSKNGSHGLL
jgi:hypothetical protein